MAESFLKSSLLNRGGGWSTTTTKKDSDESLSYMKVPAEFELDEDQEIEFDPVEDSESRPSSYMARIVTLVKIETENVPLMNPLNSNPLNSKAKQELHKRKMEILDQTILQLSKRPKTNAQITSSPFSGPTSPSTPVASSSRRKLAAGFDTRPFHSPLINKSKSAKTMIEQPIPHSFPTSIQARPGVGELRTQSSDMTPVHHHQKSKKPTMKSIISKPIIEPIRASFANPDSNKSFNKSEENVQSTANLELNKPENDDGEDLAHPDLDESKENLASNHQSNPRNYQPDSSSSSNCFERVSSKKTLKINWNSYFQPAKPT